VSRPHPSNQVHLFTRQKQIIYAQSETAKDSRTYSSSVIPFEYAGVRKEEKVVLPDGTPVGK
jgi:hypothetical protein